MESNRFPCRTIKCEDMWKSKQEHGAEKHMVSIKKNYFRAKAVVLIFTTGFQSRLIRPMLGLCLDTEIESWLL